VCADALEREVNRRKDIMICHYTKAFHLPSILSQGLRPSTLFITPGEKPILWFSTNPIWENTVLPYGAPSLQEAHLRTLDQGGLVRIICDESVAQYRWQELKEIARIPSKIAMGLYSSAIRLGSRPGEWRGTLDVVPVAKFIAIEFYDGEKWTSFGQMAMEAA
jgi:hypothetical protein